MDSQPLSDQTWNGAAPTSHGVARGVYAVLGMLERKDAPGNSNLDTPETGQSPEYSKLESIFCVLWFQQSILCAQNWLSRLGLPPRAEARAVNF